MRVLIVDDSSSFRRAARAVLERRGYAVAGEAATGRAALASAAAVRPSAALIDARLADGLGFELAAEFKWRFPRVAVVIMSTDDDGTGQTMADACGARGFVLKSDLASCDLSSFWPPPLDAETSD